MSTKVVVDGDEVFANPNYIGTPVPEGHDWTGNIPWATQRAESTAALYVAMELDIPEHGAKEQWNVRNIRHLTGRHGGVMADVKIKGEWGRYVCTRAEIEARKGGQLVDSALEVVA
jgi:hypothetical protein